MKHPKKLKRRHKEFLASQGIDHHKFWIEREGIDFYRFVEKDTERILEIRF
ncbi:DUF6906 family protein [Clostridium cadaveris]|uniref:DUF6906 family protein n=1 Tax=Clostridium cadaveris TaxID=1529 RepID=UPI0015B62B59|nr:hypothetical protein [Clostridium cadaveris]NWK11754.1 hypothetical protein [Clostridium cadaveris]